MSEMTAEELKKIEKAYPYLYLMEDNQDHRVKVHCNVELPEEERRNSVQRGYDMYKQYLDAIFLNIDGDYVDIEYDVNPNIPGFDRIRRITGYLVGTLDRFNDGKRAEEADRVKHGLPKESK